ncbi:MAG: hypothetical protein KIT09_20745 [Bryobacteraceae bacterium]|nr:hypothetical protein [Bryobacteraceae bacterium]
MKYLQAAGDIRAASGKAESRDALFGLCSSLLESVGSNVLEGERWQELRSEVGAIQTMLRPDLDAESASVIEQATRRVLVAYRSAQQQAAAAAAIEMQHILGTLNQALMALAQGRERSVSRLQQIQDSLQGASMLQDIIALKNAVFDTARFVQEEAVRERKVASEELAGLENDVQNARKFLGEAFRGLPGRPEGVRDITDGAAAPPGQSLYLAAFRFDRLDAIVQRYGAEAADELMFQLIRERLHAISASARAYRWSSSSLVGAFHRSAQDVEALRGEIAALNRAPLVRRVALGHRMAVLTAWPSHLVAEATADAPASVIEELDRFTGVSP